MFKHMVALLFLASSISALAGDSADHWLEVRTPHFVVLTDSNERQGRRIAAQFEQMRAVFHTLIPGAKDDEGVPIIVLALRDRKGFQALEPTVYLAKGQLDLAGLFMTAQDKNYVLLRLDAEGEHPFTTVYHEYTHYLMRKATWAPLWLNEGLAEFYQNTDIRDKDVLLGQPSEGDILFLREHRLIPLTTLLQVDHTSPYYHDEQKGSIFYAESWALTHYIEVTDRQKNTNHLHDYAVLLTRKEDPVTAAQHVFGDLQQLQKALDSYVGQGQFNMFKINMAFASDASSFAVRPVPRPEADAVRADVLADNGRTKEAEAMLAVSLRDDPKNALAHETMGALRLREQDMEGARKWYGEAVQLDSQSYLAQYYYAAMSLNLGDKSHDAEIEASLRASIKLNPAFAPAFDALAMFYLSRDEKLAEAHMMNVQAIQLEPENVSYRINAATVFSQGKMYPDAIRTLEAATRIATTTEEAAMLQGRIQQLKQFEAQQEKADQAPEIHTATTVSNGTALTEAQTERRTAVFQQVDGKTIGVVEDKPVYPAGDATGAKHTVDGVLRGIRCSYPSVLALKVETNGKTIALYTNNYFKVIFTTVNYDPKDDIKPCTDIENMKARVKYADVSDKNVAGQILSIDLSK